MRDPKDKATRTAIASISASERPMRRPDRAQLPAAHRSSAILGEPGADAGATAAACIGEALRRRRAGRPRQEPGRRSATVRPPAWLARAGQRDRSRARPGRVVLQLEFAAMQPRDRRRRGSGRGRSPAPSGFAPAARTVRTTRPRSPAAMPGPRSPTVSMIRSLVRAAASRRSRRDRPLAALASRRGIFDGIVDQIGERLADQFAIAVHRRRLAGLDLEASAPCPRPAARTARRCRARSRPRRTRPCRRGPRRIPRARSSTAR